MKKKLFLIVAILFISLIAIFTIFFDKIASRKGAHYFNGKISSIDKEYITLENVEMDGESSKKAKDKIVKISIEDIKKNNKNSVAVTNNKNKKLEDLKVGDLLNGQLCYYYVDSRNFIITDAYIHLSDTL